MPNTHGIGKLFFHRVELRKGTSFLHRAVTIEIEPPFRMSRSLVLRIWKWGLVLGRWDETLLDEDTALTVAIQATEIPLQDCKRNAERMSIWQWMKKN